MFRVRVVVIEVDGLVKHFRVHERGAGVSASLRSVVRRSYRQVRAVDEVSFTLQAGEVVGFLGPNGAGKTTTLKCLSGLLYPDAGSVRVLGHQPHRREAAYLSRIAMVMGQRNSLYWDLPALDAFEVHRTIYRVPPAQYRQTVAELVDLLGLEPLLSRQVRVLSLGERMRCELAAALLHRPEVLFLDEPTLGLDVNAQVVLRQFLREHNARHGSTVLLTSHYMGDVTALASRVLVIDSGRLRFDGDLATLVLWRRALRRYTGASA
jgi:ABC-2 type transport system ATP-binding protein